jgi:hypothetical protein
MLARSPLAQVWHDETNRFSRLTEDGIEIACIDCACGVWMGRLAHSVIAHRSKTTRSTVGGTAGYTSRNAAKIAVEDRIHAVRGNDGSFARSDAAALGREALAASPAPEEWEAMV